MQTIVGKPSGIVDVPQVQGSKRKPGKVILAFYPLSAFTKMRTKHA